MKVTRTVWMRGKDGDNIKVLPIHICLIFLVVIISSVYGQTDLVNDIKIYRYNGTPEEMAASFGKDEGYRFSKIYLQITRDTKMNWISQEMAFLQIKNFEAHIDEESSRELKAFAQIVDHQNVDLVYKKLLLANCFYDLTCGGCRQVCVWDKKSTDATLMHARNLDWYDWEDSLRKNNVLLIRHYPNGNSIATLTWPGMIGCLTGCNDRGLAIAFNHLYGTTGTSGEPIFLILKRVLREADTLQKALEILKSSKLCTSGSIMISSSLERDAVVIDISENKHIRVRKSEYNFVFNNNTCYFNLQGDFDLTRYRNSKIYQLINSKEIITRDMLQQIMAHPDILLDINILTVIFQLEHNKIYVACGRYGAAKGPYREIFLFDSKAKNN